ncbi:tyrosine-protein kinase JAK2 isoform X2 [Boleophthalmus pectinirostris]|uniref:tyrosine-protein kinase JAK2 isoform X2 n=1 Tax=Boleophthalmus pectinirostris TaxID=150288 RepID=UPI00242E078A|nr:tyrosine-protein kinase JAK2 isoform X2 [Boleophthalmus pectinirostris]
MDLSEEDCAPLVYRDRGGSQKSDCSSGHSLQIHLYFIPGTKEETIINISCNHVSAEDVCKQAAAKCGIFPVYQSLFALASTDLSFWYPPSHMFNGDENLLVHFRVRFFFENWYGQEPKTSYRHSLTRDRMNPVVDCGVIDYLFAQWRSDFINSEAGKSPPLTAQEDCLGLVVLDLWRMAKERHQSVRELCRSVSYKSCLPKTHRHDIQQRSRLDRYRIRNTLKRFLRKLGNNSVDACTLKVKYLIELSAIKPSLGSEVFQVDGSFSKFTHVRISGESGIQTKRDERLDEPMEWETFCDFQDIIDISVQRVCLENAGQDSRLVTVTRRDDRCLEAKFTSLKEALSFVSLIDGYFRLTTDSTHFFCQSIAPPSILEGIRNHCHGPITSDFAMNKLKKSGFRGGAFLLRQSPKSYDNYLLTVCIQTPIGLDYKDCLIIKNENFSLPGVQKSFSSLKELTSFYQHNKIILADIPIKLGRCCPPKPKELTNLIIIRGNSSVEEQDSPCPERSKFNHIQFHMIKYEDLKWSFFEAASLMSQVSYKHLLLVYGVSVHAAKNIMVQEFVKYGALDLYLKRGVSVSVSWKLDVAKQLASALNFLEEKNIVHGNICAKNLLLAREGDPSQGDLPFIKLSDPGVSVAMLGKDVVLDRIPWVAPEVVEAPEKLSLESDKWSYGATLWEIFNRNTPLRGWDLDRKRQFYESFQQLPRSQWTELADLISQCMDYQADFRPSSRSIIRQINSLITSDYVILHATDSVSQNAVWKALTPQQNDMLFEERHLCYISLLGKGNFGSVELCRYDPLGDSTGDLVAVKKLQPNKQSTVEDFHKEVNTLSALNCDYIVKYRGICYSTGRLNMSLVMEYLPFGSLINYMEKFPDSVNIRRLLLFASQICKGMKYLQDKRYVHRDLAARNILVADHSRVKIADFGLTKVIPCDKEYYRVTQPGESPIFWYAPESLTEFKFSSKSDVWSFGVLLHELFSYCNANFNPKRLCMQEIGHGVQGPSISMYLANIIKNGWRLPAPLHCPTKVYGMMKQCWLYNYEDRPGFSGLEEQIEAMIQEER